MGPKNTFWSCCGLRKIPQQDDREPLLPRYKDDTSMQRELHQKLHSYQMYRALGRGYMPSNEQTIVNLRTLLAADLFSPDNTDLSDSGRLLTRYTKQWLQQFIELLQHKNNEDQIQDFIWFLSKSRLSVDTDDIAHRASKASSKANTAAAFQSLHTVGSLLLTNSDFRLFLSDLNVIGRDVFKDTAFAVSSAAEEAGNKLEPTEDERKTVKGPGADAGPAPTGDDLKGEVADVSQVVGQSVATVAVEAEHSIAEKVTGDEKDTLIRRLQEAVTKLRKRNDYTDSVSTITLLIKRYAMVYSRAVQETVDTAQQDVHENAEMDRAFQNAWSLIKSFGDSKQWDELEGQLRQVISHKDTDPEFENLMLELGNSVQDLLTDPTFFDEAEARFKKLREKSRQVGTDSSLRRDIDGLLEQLPATFQSVLQDTDVAKLLTTTSRIVSILSPTQAYINSDLLTDSLNVFVPLLIQLIQYIPIPRLEVSTPDIDLLLENLIIEPGQTVNHTSFLPFRFKATTLADFEVRKALTGATSSTSTLVTLQLDGLSLRADDLGFWFRAHKGLLRLADSGIASIALDERGLDIHLDVEVGRDRLEQILTLRAVRVHVHKLRYDVRRSRFSWLTSWLLAPLLRPLLRRTIERQLASGIEAFLHAANRELVFARERLRATRVADPKDLATFVRAVAARLAPEDDPDVYTRVGVDEPGKGVFKGVYAPGSVVKLWKEEAERAAERVEDGGEVRGWKNAVFDVHVVGSA